MRPSTAVDGVCVLWDEPLVRSSFLAGIVSTARCLKDDDLDQMNRPPLEFAGEALALSSASTNEEVSEFSSTS